jgi:hypothetical protein
MDFPIAAYQMNVTANFGDNLQLVSKARAWMTASIGPSNFDICPIIDSQVRRIVSMV